MSIPKLDLASIHHRCVGAVTARLPGLREAAAANDPQLWASRLSDMIRVAEDYETSALEIQIDREAQGR